MARVYDTSAHLRSTIEHLNHVRGQVTYDQDFEAYRWKKPSKLLAGVTRLLKKRFYPNTRTRPKPKGTVRKRYPGGRRGGRLVHEQVRELILAIRREHARGWAPHPSRELDPRVRSIIQEIRARRWRVVDAEFIVADPRARLATAADLVCATPDGHITLVEIKTGHDSLYAEATNERMESPFQELNRAPYWQHQLQLLATCELYRRFVGSPATSAEVWLVGAAGTVARPIPPIQIFPLHWRLNQAAGTRLVDILGLTPRIRD